MTVTLQRRKQLLVRDAIWDTAIKLFDQKGFDKTTVENIAHASGVSRRSFFRYFSSKDDLLAKAMISYGEWLAHAIESRPRSSSMVEVIRDTTIEIAERIAAEPRTRAVIRIAEKSFAARQAQNSAMATVEDMVTQAFAARQKKRQTNELQARLLALVTLSIMKAAIAVWAKSRTQKMSRIIRQALPTLMRSFS
jgi:AcrR family transcriptional regulator